jgi:hypothetical protein
VPFHLEARVYNSAGELVRTLYVGAASEEPTELDLDKNDFVGSQDKVDLLLHGQLSGAPNGLSWDGSNDGGQWVSAGSYTIQVQVTDPFGQTSSFFKPVTVLPVQSETWLNLTNEAGETVWAQHLSTPVSNWSLSSESIVLAGEGTGNGAPVLRINLDLAGGGTSFVDWDGRGANGRLLNSGVYQLTLSSIQPGQSARVQTKTITILRGADADLLAGAILGPNPAHGVDTVQVRYTPVANLDGASAELYTLDGGRVTTALDPGKTGTIVLPVSSLSGGVYACVVTLGPARRVLKLAVVR